MCADAKAASTSPKFLRTKATSVEWPVIEFAGRRIGRKQYGQLFDLDRDEFGGILGEVWIGREHDGDRFADVAHAVRRQDRLAVRIEPLDAGQAKIDRRNVGDVGCRPHRDNAWRCLRGVGVDRHDAPMGVGGAHHAHVQLMSKRNIGREQPAAGNQRRIFEPRNRTADEGHGSGRSL